MQLCFSRVLNWTEPNRTKRKTHTNKYARPIYSITCCIYTIIMLMMANLPFLSSSLISTVFCFVLLATLQHTHSSLAERFASRFMNSILQYARIFLSCFFSTRGSFNDHIGSCTADSWLKTWIQKHENTFLRSNTLQCGISLEKSVSTERYIIFYETIVIDWMITDRTMFVYGCFARAKVNTFLWISVLRAIILWLLSSANHFASI